MTDDELRGEVVELREQVERLRYERRLLGSARMTLDLLSAGGTERWDSLRHEAGVLSQRIVDEIGHPVTDEPALGPELRETVAKQRRKIAKLRELAFRHKPECQMNMPVPDGFPFPTFSCNCGIGLLP